ncbi:MAG: type II CAAX endopeptidase family protein [Balneolaceae bacterium]|nr:type II CAAX endopeptidase family protein [Balneolaceae bacterium]
MNIFVNDSDKRIRAGWRIALQLILFWVFMVSMLIANESMITQDLKLYNALSMGIAGLASVWVAAIILDHRPILDYGLGWDSTWKKELGLGILFGTSAMGAIFLVAWSADWLTVTGYGWERSSSIPYGLWLITYFMAMAIIGFYEELLFRGYQILNLAEGFQFLKKRPLYPCLLAVGLSSIAFALMHAGNANASLMSTVNIAIGGAVLAVPYIYTGRLALSIGLHFSWNVVQGGIFGFAVSGTPFRGSLIQAQNQGAEYITGGAFGPEGGLLGLLGLALILGLCLWYVSRTASLKTPHQIFLSSGSDFDKRDEQR